MDFVGAVLLPTRRC